MYMTDSFPETSHNGIGHRQVVRARRRIVPRILVVDDEPLISMMLEAWLAELDCETVGAHSVRGALALLDGAALDGALLDVSLGPGEKCYSLAAVLRDRGIPFAFLTGYEAEDIDARFRKTLVLCKPFEFDAVKVAILKLLSPAPSGC
jgi:CheY-like chemotaxis protein